MARMRERLDVPVMCGVGAAFDFHAGRISQAPRWMQERGLEWIYRIAQEPRRLLPRYLRYNPRFVLGVRAPVPARAPATAATPIDCRRMPTRRVAVVGLGRVGLPLALSFADRGLRRDRRRAATRRVLDAVARRPRCRSRRPAPRSCSSACCDGGRLELTPSASQDAAAGATTSCSRSARRAYSHIEIDISRHPHRARRPAAGAARGPLAVLRSTVAPGHDRVGGRLPRAAARLPGRRGPVRRARARADRREPLPRGDRDAAVHRRRRRRATRATQAARAVRGVRRRDRADHARCRPSWRRSGPTSCATRSSRCPTC